MTPSLMWRVSEDIWYHRVHLANLPSPIPSSSSSYSPSSTASSSSDDSAVTVAGDNPSGDIGTILKPSQAETEANWAYDRMVKLERKTGRNDWDNYDVVQEHFDMDSELLDWVVDLNSEKNKNVEVTLEYLSQNMPHPKDHSFPPMSDEDIVDLHAIIMYERVVRMGQISEAEKWEGSKPWEKKDPELSKPISTASTPRRRKRIGKREPIPGPKVFCTSPGPEFITKDQRDSALFGNSSTKEPSPEEDHDASVGSTSSGELYWIADDPPSPEEAEPPSFATILNSLKRDAVVPPVVNETKFGKRMAAYNKVTDRWPVSLSMREKRDDSPKEESPDTGDEKRPKTVSPKEGEETLMLPPDEQERPSKCSKKIAQLAPSEWSGDENNEASPSAPMNLKKMSMILKEATTKTAGTKRAGEMKKATATVECPGTNNTEKRQEPKLQTKESSSTPEKQTVSGIHSPPGPGSLKRARPLNSSPKTPAATSKENTPATSTPAKKRKEEEQQTSTQRKRRRPPGANKLISVGKVGPYDKVWTMSEFLEGCSSPPETPSKSKSGESSSKAPSTKQMKSRVTASSSKPIKTPTKQTALPSHTGNMIVIPGKEWKNATPKDIGSRVAKSKAAAKKRGRPTKAAVLAKKKGKEVDADWDMEGDTD